MINGTPFPTQSPAIPTATANPAMQSGPSAFSGGNSAYGIPWHQGFVWGAAGAGYALNPYNGWWY